jgi:uncharacterized protein YcaQ
VTRLSIPEARRIALAAQGFRPKRRAGLRELRRLIRELGLLQIDYVNVLLPSQYLVPFSRLRPYDRSLLDELTYRRRELTEQWAREASIVPVDAWRLLRHRMDEQDRWWGRVFARFIAAHPEYAERVLKEVGKRGPLTAADIAEPDGSRATRSKFWGWTMAKRALESHFGRGFARSYDLADYYRMPVRETRLRIGELVSAGELEEVRVEGWNDAAYLHTGAVKPRAVVASALLSPFDLLVWHRARAKRLFDFDYVLEIWVPRGKRRWGYYVLPFLLDDRLAARVDLKADRAGRRLLVIAAYLEKGARAPRVAKALATELGTLARWLNLDVVKVLGRTRFARRLAEAIGAGS